MQSFTADISKLIEMVVLTYKLVSFVLTCFVHTYCILALNIRTNSFDSII